MRLETEVFEYDRDALVQGLCAIYLHLEATEGMGKARKSVQVALSDQVQPASRANRQQSLVQGASVAARAVRGFWLGDLPDSG